MDKPICSQCHYYCVFSGNPELSWFCCNSGCDTYLVREASPEEIAVWRLGGILAFGRTGHYESSKED